MNYGLSPQKTCCLLLGLLIFSICPLILPEASAGDVVIISNKDVPDSALSKSALRNIYIGKKTEWFLAMVPLFDMYCPFCWISDWMYSNYKRLRVFRPRAISEILGQLQCKRL